MAGRGSFIELFPLFGYDLNDYDALFAEKLELLVKIRDSERVTWSGEHRAPLQRPGGLSAHAEQDPDLGRGRRQPAVGDPRRHARPADGARHHRRHAGALSRRSSICSARRRSRPATTRRQLPVGINTHGYVADTSQAGGRRVLSELRRADDPHRPRARLAADHARAVRRRPCICARISRSAVPQQVIEKILFQHEALGHQRYLMQMSVGTMPHAQTMRSIELFGTKVAPAVRSALKNS